MALANDDPDNATSDSESVPSHNSPQLPAAGSESPPGLVEDIAAYDLGVHHTCRVGSQYLFRCSIGFRGVVASRYL
ncbi:hypothetical protein ACHAPC_008902 [Botrytis cinerea]